MEYGKISSKLTVHVFLLQTTILVSNLLMGTDPDYFEDVLLYKPERWIRGDDNLGINPYLVNSFGFGPRMCLGRPHCFQVFTQLLIVPAPNYLCKKLIYSMHVYQT